MSNEVKAIQTEYRGFKFRSRLEARWAVFFDACGVKWEYEPEGYDLGDGLLYLPDFLLHDVTLGRDGKGDQGNDLFVEVKGVMSYEDAAKVDRFAAKYPIIVVTDIPANKDDAWEMAYDAELKGGHTVFSFDTVDGDTYYAFPCVDIYGKFRLIGGDYTHNMDKEKTECAYQFSTTGKIRARGNADD